MKNEKNEREIERERENERTKDNQKDREEKKKKTTDGLIEGGTESPGLD